MNKTLAYVLAAIIAALTGLASLDVTGILPLLSDFLPEQVVKGIAVVPTLAAVLVHAIQAAMERIDKDAQDINRSFRLVPLLLLGAAVLMLPSCSGILAGMTGQPIPTTPVSRDGGPPIQVATADVLRAETAAPDTAWGLYNAGAVAAQTARVIDSGK